MLYSSKLKGRNKELSDLPATFSFSAVPELGIAVVVLFVEFAPVPLIARFSTLDSSFPIRCNILSSKTARVFFKSKSGKEMKPISITKENINK